MKKSQGGSIILVIIFIILILIIIVFSIKAYRSYVASHPPRYLNGTIIDPTQGDPNDLTPTIGYRNSKYDFEFEYPPRYVPEEQSTPNFSVTLVYKGYREPIKVVVFKPDSNLIKDVINPKLENNQQKTTIQTIQSRDTVWQGFEIEDVPVEGIGTAGIQETYFTTYNSYIYVASCYNCDPRVMGDTFKADHEAYIDLVKSFKFNLER